MYIIHDDDGTILHSVGGPDKTYGDVLTKSGQQWIFLEGQFEFNPVTQYVDLEKKAAGTPHVECLAERYAPSMAIDKSIITSGTDTATITGIPAGAHVKIISDAGVEFEGAVNDGEIELTAPDPTTYTVHVTAGARYLPVSIQVVAQ